MADPDHRAIIAGLSPDQRRALTTLADGPGLRRLAFHLGLIALLGILIAERVLQFWPLLLVPQGILIVFLFTTVHETIHETAFRTQRMNSVVATFCGFLNLLPPAWFRFFHFAHHRHTQDPDHDPELMSPKPETLPQYLKYLSGLPYWTGMAKVLANNAIGRRIEGFVPDKGRHKVIEESRKFLLVYAMLLAASVALQTTVLLWTWIIPALIGQPFLRAYLLAEHTRCPQVANMLENTRTTFTTRLVRLIAWNMPYHAEHHSYPAVPFHRLPAFHSVVAAHLRSTEKGYVRFHRKLIRSLQ